MYSSFLPNITKNSEMKHVSGGTSNYINIYNGLQMFKKNSQLKDEGNQTDVSF